MHAPKVQLLLIAAFSLAACGTIPPTYQPLTKETARVRFVADAPGNVHFAHSPDLICEMKNPSITYQHERPIAGLHPWASPIDRLLSSGKPKRIGVHGAGPDCEWAAWEELLDANRTSYVITSAISQKPSGLAICAVVAEIRLQAGKDYEFTYKGNGSDCRVTVEQLSIDTTTNQLLRSPVDFRPLPIDCRRSK